MASDVNVRLFFYFPTYHCKKGRTEQKGNAAHGAGEGSSGQEHKAFGRCSFGCRGSKILFFMKDEILH